MVNTSKTRRIGALAAKAGSLALIAGLVVALPANPAQADTVPPVGTPETVSADSLPTAQIDGVVWSQAIVGNTVYAVGAFAKARPAGTLPGDPAEVVRSNFVAYDLTTGNLLPLVHDLNAQGMVVKASPDGSTVYIGGDFTTVDGIPRNKIAAFSASTGALLDNFTPSPGGQVRALAITDTKVYAGGAFGTVNGFTRTKLAAFNRADGALLSWKPSADDDLVEALATTDGQRIIVGGRFQTLNGQPKVGVGAIDGVTGELLPWSSRPTPSRIDTKRSWVTSLTISDGKVFATDDGEGGNWFDGRWAADYATGDLIWLDNCYGASYSGAVIGQAFYSVGHAHDCASVNAFPETSPRSWHRALAETVYPTGIDQTAPSSNSNYSHQPIPTQLHWYPTVSPGTITGQEQGGWSLATNGTYLVMAGEFPKVNSIAQQGLARFAIKSAAPNKVGPVPNATLNATVLSLQPGQARVSWKSTWDMDNSTLRYDVFRDGNTTTPVYTTTLTNNFWNLPQMGFTDTGLAPGSTHTYKVRVTDPMNNRTGASLAGSVTIATDPIGGYPQKVLADGASSYWRLGEGGTTAVDWSGIEDAAAGTGVTGGGAGALNGDSNAASVFNGTTSGIVVSRNKIPAPSALSIEAWFKTTSTSGGKIVGYGTAASGSSGSYDRHLYLDNSGRLFFGVYNGAARTLSTGTGLNDGQWHHVVGTLDPTDGMALFVDGRRVGRDPNTVSANSYLGYWRIGGDTTNSWPNKPSSYYLNGSIDDVAIYPTALSTAKVLSHYTTSGRTAPAVTAPTGKYAGAVAADAPESYWRLGDASGSTTAVDSAGNGIDGSVQGGVTLGSAGAPIVGSTDTAATFNGSNGIVVSKYPVVNPRKYTVEAWVNTTTNRGGKIIGFGSASSGLSTSYDRHVYMLNNGKVSFGAAPSGQVILTSTSAINDGQWHHVAASQGPEGMRLYIDGVLQASNAEANSQAYTGYWRVGGDRVWSGATSNYLSGRIDEAAVYPRALSAASIRSHYLVGTTGAFPPVASFTSSCTLLACTFDASASSDAESGIASYSWNFGDSTTATGATPSKTYAAGGTYTVTLTVTDGTGVTGTTTASVVATAPNAAPTASFTKSCTSLSCTFNAAASSDSDGTVASYAWDYGDGTTGTGVNPTKVYAANGTYTVTLTVTDNAGATGTTTSTVTVTKVIVAPTAAFTSSCTSVVCSFDGSGSSDPDGTVASYAWDFGDSTSGTGATPSKTYAASGTYTVTLTVTDSDGATGTLSKDVTVTKTNLSPTASFTTSCTALVCSVDASASSDPDGSIASYAWDFGDSSTGTGATSSRTYDAPGTYTVTLTVTDDGGATATATKTVSPVAVYATDAFGRTVANGWGTADLGGAWTGGTASNYAVNGGVGTMKMVAAASGPFAYLNGVSARDVEVAVTFSEDKVATGGGIYQSVIARRVAGVGDYRAKVRLLASGAVAISLASANSAGVETVIAPETTVPGLTFAAGDQLRVRLQTVGASPTTVRAMVWKASGTMPASWQVTATDSTAGLQVAGSVALRAYLSGTATNAPVVTSVDDLWVGWNG